ncbi:MAG: hypothetical protein AABZ33_01185 [Chloroflexota bacterium]|mgnify:CR=1 FL=1
MLNHIDKTIDEQLPSVKGGALCCCVRECHPRLLRAREQLVFLTNGVILLLAVERYVVNDAANEALRRPLFGMHRTAWPDGTSVEFHVPHGEWIRLLREHGLEIERLVEIQAPPDAVDNAKYTHVTADWARKWPFEEAWVARKRG